MINQKKNLVILEQLKCSIVQAHNTLAHCSWKKAAGFAGVVLPTGWQPFCRTCAAARMHRAPKAKFTQEPNPGTRPGQYLHVDLHGKVRDPTPNGCIYFAVVIDDFSGRVFTFLLRKKSEFTSRFAELLLQIQGDTGDVTSRVKSDGDGIFRSEVFKALLRKNGIEHCRSPPYSSHCNGKAERCIGILKDMARAQLIQSGLPRRYWGEAVVYASQILNRTKRKGTQAPFSCP